MERGALTRPASLLDGWFTSDVAQVAAAARALVADPIAREELAPADRSWGAVRLPIASVAGRAAREGILSEQTFGPVRVLACACGAVAGEARAGETCRACGVLCADPSLRTWRFGHLDVPPLVHPLLVADVARALRVTTHDVEAVLRLDASIAGGVVTHAARAGHVDSELAGPHAIAAALEASSAPSALLDAAIVRRVPVPPPGDRPLVEDLLPLQRVPWIGPVNELWLALVSRATRYARLEELQAPTIIVVNEAHLAQAALADVVAATVAATRAPPPVLERVRWHAPRPPDAHEDALPGDAPLSLGRPPLAIDAAMARPREWGPRAYTAAVFVDEDHVVVQRALQIHVVDVRDGRVACSFPSPARALMSAHAAADGAVRVRFDGWLDAPWGWPLDGDEDDALLRAAGGSFADAAIYELAPGFATAHEAAAPASGSLGRYLDAWPDDVPAFTVAQHAAEELFLVDRRTGAHLPCPWGDRPRVLAWSGDARHAWLGTARDGGVLDVDAGIPLVEPRLAGAAPEREPAGQDAAEDGADPFEDGFDDDADEDGPQPARAVGVTSGLAWRFVHEDGALSDGAQVIAHLGTADAFAFAPGCALVAIVRGDVLAIVDAIGRPVRTLPLP